LPSEELICWWSAAGNRGNECHRAFAFLDEKYDWETNVNINTDGSVPVTVWPDGDFKGDNSPGQQGQDSVQFWC
jgi:hypothetical protein